VSLNSVAAHDNAGDGIFIDAYSGDGDATVTLSHAAAHRNGADGIHVYAYADGDLTFNMRNGGAVDNGDDGLDLGLYAGGTTTARVRSAQFFDNGDFDLENDGDNINAANNWWGQNADPALNGQIGGANAGGVTTAPWTSSP
jgi:hypothetical protein